MACTDCLTPTSEVWGEHCLRMLFTSVKRYSKALQHMELRRDTFMYVHPRICTYPSEHFPSGGENSRFLHYAVAFAPVSVGMT